MKYHYKLKIDGQSKNLLIEIFARRTEDTTDYLGNAQYSEADILAAIAAGEQALVDVIRRDSMYPPVAIAIKLAKAASELFSGESEDTEIVVEEIDVKKKEVPVPVVVEEEESADEEADDSSDDLLEEDFEAESILGDDKVVPPVVAPKKIVDDDSE